jgi:hypothetical protein
MKELQISTDKFGSSRDETEQNLGAITTSIMGMEAIDTTLTGKEHHSQKEISLHQRPYYREVRLVQRSILRSISAWSAIPLAVGRTLHRAGTSIGPRRR